MSSRIRTRIAALSVAGLLAVPLAGTATADPGQGAIGTIVGGTAEVGKYFDANDPCDKTGVAIVHGRGLYAPGVDGYKLPNQEYVDGTVDARENNGVFAFSGAYTLIQLNNPNKDENPHVSTGVLDVCGYLAPVPNTGAKKENRHSGLGAACGASKGHHGQGEAIDDGGFKKFKLWDVGWKAGFGVIPITGNYTEYDPDTGDKKKSGGFFALASARGTGLDCFGDLLGGNPHGAQTFNIDLVFKLVNGAKADPNEVKPKTDGDQKQCKGTAKPPFDDPGDKAHTNKPDKSKENCPEFKPAAS